jgi:hypothetical protein
MATLVKRVVSWQEFSELWFVGVGRAVGAERDWIEGDGWGFGAFRLGLVVNWL